MALLGVLLAVLGFGTRLGQMAVDLAVVWTTPSSPPAIPHVTAPAARRPYSVMDRLQPDASARWRPRGHVIPDSAWLDREREFHRARLLRGGHDIVVAPGEVELNGFDYPTRLYLSGRIAAALRDAGRGSVADPVAVARALGEGRRRLDDDALLALAGELGASTLVRLFLGHDRAGELSLRLRRHEAEAGKPLGADSPVTERRLQLTFSSSPSAVWTLEENLPRILAELGVEPGETSVGAPPSVAPWDGFPAFPAEDESTVSGLDAARHLQLLGALAPEMAQRFRERVFTRSRLALASVPAGVPGRALLDARAFMYLGDRVSALAALGTPGTAEERALAAALDGRLPALEEATAAITDETELFHALAMLGDVRRDFGLTTDAATARDLQRLALPDGPWQVLVERRLRDADIWFRPDNVAIKRLLDLFFPVEGFTAESLLAEGLTAGDGRTPTRRFDLSVLEHRRRLLENDPGRWCCEQPRLGATIADHFELLVEVGHLNVVRAGEFLRRVQGRAALAMQHTESLLPAYQDHPELVYRRAKIAIDLAEKMTQADREVTLGSAYRDLVHVLFWSEGQTRLAGLAWDALVAMRRMDFGYLNNPYAGDLPFRSEYPTWEGGGSPAMVLRNQHAALRNATSQYYVAARLLHALRERPEERAEVDAVLAGRFDGHPDRTLALAEDGLRAGSVEQALATLRDAVARQPDPWRVRYRLGELLIHEARYDEAAQVLEAHPGFVSLAGEPVALSNMARNAGDLFYWRGRVEPARRLLALAADLRTGSNASMSAAARIATLDGDFVAAAQMLLQTVQRYGSALGTRDYLGWLHVLGYSEQAWQSFDALIGKDVRPQLWESTLVGHRVTRRTDEEVIAWTRRSNVRSVFDGPRNAAARALLMDAVTDRTPSLARIEAIEELSEPVWQLPYHHDYVVREDRASNRYPIYGPSLDEPSILPLNVFRQEGAKRVVSESVYFARAYRALLERDFAAAYDQLSEMAGLYDLRIREQRFALPYLAFAAAAAGRAAEFEARFADLAPEGRGFDWFLAMAIVKAFSREHTAAMDLLARSLGRSVLTGGRSISPHYVHAEICEWLWRETGHAAYRDAALDWARRLQRIDPVQAWAYTIEATLTDDAASRARALEFAVYLDPGSRRLTAVDEAELAAARAAVARENPFARSQRAAAPEGVTM
ncbi:MAG: tetratricopeptide repeat protein [Ectothiorhodospiraceae bacterium]|nr:tetratricopeptide repeat protein [Chromatiales bacterium]MCP5154029.1 tetratricopeptide repeat protein [Ectothiorhodospiraceae bacterium]